MRTKRCQQTGHRYGGVVRSRLARRWERRCRRRSCGAVLVVLTDEQHAKGDLPPSLVVLRARKGGRLCARYVG